MKIRPYLICDEIIKKIAVDENLNQHCIAVYGKKPEFFLGLNHDDPPSASSMPTIAIEPSAFGIADDFNHNEMTIRIGCMIEAAGSTKAVDEITRFIGFERITELMEYVQEAVIEATTNSLSQDRFALKNIGTISVSQFYPYYNGQFEITIATEA